MFCESYRQPLIDSLAAGEPLSGEFAMHLVGCHGCSTAFSKEQALYAAIETSLGVAANALVPPSLIPRVQAQIVACPDKVFWRSPILAFATLVLVTGMAALSPVFHWRSTRTFSRQENQQAAAPNVQFADRHDAIKSSVQTAPSIERYSPKSKPGSVVLSHAKARVGAEVLISPEEQAGLERYASDLRGRVVENAARAASVTTDTTFKIEPLQIATMGQQQLTIEPLESDEYN